METKKTKEEAFQECPVAKTIALFQGKWMTRVIYELGRGETLRFGELKSMINGITNTMLTSTLKELEMVGVINRKQFNEIPPHVEYSLTEKGEAMSPIFEAMYNWGASYL
jgi:DNA-binding HxlR family transcriptional regulator